MLFATYRFFFFFVVVFSLYWVVCRNSKQRQNLLLLIVSLVFYSAWDIRFIILLSTSILVNYYAGVLIVSQLARSKVWLILSVLLNLGILAMFKYYDFFAESLHAIIPVLNLPLLHLILPVGISFYTFHGLSYCFDLYRKKIEIEKDIVIFSLFIAYFPLLVAGPIERATHLLPQLKTVRVFDNAAARDGLRQVLWGLFKKVVIADTCANLCDPIFLNYHQHSGFTLLLASLLFTVQIYADFSGYSDMALGVSRLLGIELLRNFSFPYFSRDITEFWRRWHMSLSGWFRDYLYIPLGGSRHGNVRRAINVMLVFLLSGFWHGANTGFLMWGFLNGALYLPYVLFPKLMQYSEYRSIDANLIDLPKIILTFLLVNVLWIFFRMATVSQALDFISSMCSPINWFKSEIKLQWLWLLLPFFFVVEWLGRSKQHALVQLAACPKYVRWIAYYSLLVLVMEFWGKDKAFIYFQF